MRKRFQVIFKNKNEADISVCIFLVRARVALTSSKNFGGNKMQNDIGEKDLFLQHTLPEM